MGRKARPAMAGLEELGFRLKDLRSRAGISQMELSRRIGFDPTHGYKYILRLEKGLVANPTLRTIAACLEACGATWRDVVDVLPATGPAAARKPNPPAKSELEPAPAPTPMPEAAPLTTIDNRESEIPAPARRRDSRPMREQLRQRRIEDRRHRAERFWASAKRSEEATRSLLRTQRVPSDKHASYLAFARVCCSSLDAMEAARPEAADRELGRLSQAHATQGLDRKLLAQIQSVCTQLCRSQDTA
jgi:transcriptional regulator with XRE-family HTH domain